MYICCNKIAFLPQVLVVGIQLKEVDVLVPLIIPIDACDCLELRNGVTFTKNVNFFTKQGRLYSTMPERSI